MSEPQPQPQTAPVVPGGGGAGHASSLKLPEFWSESPELWFAQVNCIFATSDVTGSFDMFCHTVAALQHDALLIVADIERALRRILLLLFRPGSSHPTGLLIISGRRSWWQ
jgi:hypothetical protein